MNIVIRILVCLLALSSMTFAQDDQTTVTTAPTTQTALGDSPAIQKIEFIFEKAPFPSCHASTIAQTKTGLVAAWFGGTRERNPDVGIWVSRNDGNGWSEPTEVANGIQADGKPRVPTWNPALFQSPDGPLLLFYKVGPTPQTWWGEMKTSTDDGKSWSAANKLPNGMLGPVKNKPVLLSDNVLLCPSSVEGSNTGIHMEFTPDLGATWTKTEPLSEGKPSLIQPAILDHGGGNLQYLCRTKGNIYQGFSSDNGKTWSKPEATSLPCPGSGLDAVQLKDGRSLLVYDNSPLERRPLCINLSKDGKTWGEPILIEDTGEKGPQLSYPAAIQTSDGLVHLTYTWERKRIRHVVIDPAKIP